MIAASNPRLTQTPSDTPPRANTIAVSGARGLVGSALTRAVEARGGTVRRLARNSSADGSKDEITWNPESGSLDSTLFKDVDSVIHLAGENIASGRWTTAKKQRIRDSRVIGTRRLCEALSRIASPPRVLVCASAIGFYGERGDQLLTEADLPGTGFLPDVCAQWERATSPAAAAGIRVVNLRIGVVLSRDGGALQQMLLPFQLGLGGQVGNGRQYWSWISLPDLVRSILFAIDNESLSGPINAVAPSAVTNQEFTRVMGKVLKRPTLFPLPAFAARFVLGEMANDLLLASVRVAPEQLLQHGFRFEHGDLETALRAVLNRIVSEAK
ncbi:MAG: TIGR01777 family protein [Planctomycetes bacterium]|nr:TIGR01777 family protein [Planctomycetota bacterium]